MSDVATTKMSSKGQVVIPEAIRERLNLKPGSRFVVLASEDAVILKAIEAPTLSQFNDLLRAARRAAREAGLKRADIAVAIKGVRDAK
ncbi:MAG: AbrB/MazE/SpoVT family DNA-binding domain-containing protein [Kiloniellales bacterium]